MPATLFANDVRAGRRLEQQNAWDTDRKNEKFFAAARLQLRIYIYVMKRAQEDTHNNNQYRESWLEVVNIHVYGTYTCTPHYIPVVAVATAHATKIATSKGLVTLVLLALTVRRRCTTTCIVSHAALICAVHGRHCTNLTLKGLVRMLFACTPVNDLGGK